MRAVAIVFVLATLACGDYGPADPQPSPTASQTLPGVTIGPAAGPSKIVLAAADPVPGTVSGCGTTVAGCAGRIRLTFRVTATANGSVLFYRGFLHATDKIACLQGSGTGSALRAGEPQAVEIVFDQVDTSDRCRVPLDISNLAFNVEGTIEVASRQEWALGYRLAP